MALAIPSQAGAGRVIHGGLRGLAASTLVGLTAGVTHEISNGYAEIVASVIAAAAGLLCVVLTKLLSRKPEPDGEAEELRKLAEHLRRENDRLWRELERRQ